VGRRGEACARCGAKRHGKRRHVSGSSVMAPCARCGAGICGDHAVWDSPSSAWVCRNGTLCERDARRPA